jgi:hypothetical protein
VQIVHRLGGVVAIGTTWPATGSMTTTRELACAAEWNRDRLDGYFSDRDLWEMATLNGAVATGSDAEIGSLEVGKQGDVAVFDLAGREPFEAIIQAGAHDAVLVLRGGQALYGETASIDALRPGCETLDVCEASRSLCAEAELGIAWPALEKAVAGAYGAIQCGEVPDDEPTCVPSRPGEYSGSTGDDADGDGLSDAEDLCPRIFSPVRPMDHDVQPDADGDGQGDACDETPIGTDQDADGVTNDGDVCPLDEDAAQGDGDADGKGDVCDPCPKTSNPDRGCP